MARKRFRSTVTWPDVLVGAVRPLTLALSVHVVAGACAAPGQRRETNSPHHAVPLAIGESFVIPSKELNEERRINIYLPAGYKPSDTTRFPVLYMPDGGLAEDFLHVAGLIQVLVGNGTMRAFILVGIENTERRRDMTGPTNSESDKRIAPRVGGSAAFRTFIRAELMPSIRERYRTTTETAIVGESLAGLFVVETLLLDPGLFDTYIAFDPSLWWNDGLMSRTAGGMLATQVRSLSGKAVYLATSGDAGLAEFVNPLMLELHRLSSNGLRSFHQPMPQETHATLYHPAALQAFRTVFSAARR